MSGINLGSAYGKIEIGTDQAEQSISSLADSMRKAGTAMSLGVTAPLVGIAATAIDSAADFEQSLNIMAQVSGATADQMAMMQQQALDLGAATSFSAGEAAQAQLELAKAGLKPMEVFAAMPGVLDMAAAGGMGVAQAAEIAANAVNTFGLNASDTTDIANMLAAAANASSVDITDLAAGMTMAGAVFSSAGQSIDDLNIAMALLGNNGIKGSDAGTSLKTALMRLTAPTDEASAALAGLGVNVFDAQGNMREFPAILADLQQGLYGTNAVTVTSSNLTAEQAKRMEYLKSTISKTQTQLANYASGIAGVAQSENDKVVAQDRLNRTLAAAQAEYAQLAAIGGTTSTVMKTLTEEQRQQALSTIFGADAIRSISVLMSEGTDGWNEMADALGVAGAATDVANSRMKGMRGAIEYLKGSIDSFLIGAALPYLDMMGNFVRMTADGLTAIGSLPRPLMDAAVAFGAVLAAAGPLMLAITGISAAIGFLLSPIGLIVVGVGALAAAWATNFGGIRDLTAEIAAQVGPALQSIIYPLQMIGLAMLDAGVNSGEASEAIGLLPAALQPVAVGFQNLYANTMALAGTLAAFFAPAIQRLQEAFTAMPAALAPIMPKLGELAAAAGGLVTALQPLVMLVGAGLAIAADFGVNALAAVFNNLPGLVGPIIDQVTATLRLITSVLTAVIAAVQAAIDGDWAGVWAAAQDGVEAFSTFYRGLLSRLGTFTATIAKVLYEAIVNTLKDMGLDITPHLEGIRKTFEDIWAKVQGYIQPVIDLIATVTEAISAFKDFLGGISLPNPFAPLADAWNTVASHLPGGGGGADGDPSTPQAIGTSYFRGGAAQINERGYEQIVLPAGARIYTNGQTNNLPTSEGKTININLGGVTVRSEADARRLGDILRDQLVMAGV